MLCDFQAQEQKTGVCVSFLISSSLQMHIPNAMEVTEKQILFLKVTMYQLIQPLQGETDWDSFFEGNDHQYSLRLSTTNGFPVRTEDAYRSKVVSAKPLNWTWQRVPIKMKQTASNTQDFPCYTISSDTDSWLHLKNPEKQKITRDMKQTTNQGANLTQSQVHTGFFPARGVHLTTWDKVTRIRWDEFDPVIYLKGVVI